MGGRVCHIWVGFVICGGVCHIWAGFVKYGRDLSPFGVCHFFGGICQIWAGFVTGFVTKSGDKPQKVPISDKPRDKSHNISILLNSKVLLTSKVLFMLKLKDNYVVILSEFRYINPLETVECWPDWLECQDEETSRTSGAPLARLPF